MIKLKHFNLENGYVFKLQLDSTNMTETVTIIKKSKTTKVLFNGAIVDTFPTNEYRSYKDILNQSLNVPTFIRRIINEKLEEELKDENRI